MPTTIGLEPIKIVADEMGLPRSITYSGLELQNLLPIIGFAVSYTLGNKMLLTLTVDAPVVIDTYRR